MPSANRILKTQIRDAYDRNIKNFWIQGYGEPDHEYEQIYSEMSISTEDERWSYMSGLGRWQEKEFGGLVSYDGIYQGLVKIVALAKSLVINGERLNAICAW
jgi:hypothetical protein